MAVTLRLARHGRKKRPFYRIVATEKESRRDGRFIEVVGFYNPLTNPPEVTVKEDRVQRWLSLGAKPTRVVRNLINKKVPGAVSAREEARRKKIQEQRKARKARLKARGQEWNSKKKAGDSKRTKKTAKKS